MPKLTCWVITDGKIGMENQGRGLAEAMGLDPVMKRVVLRSPWRQLSPFLRLGSAYAASPSGDPIEAPWPDVVISVGRQSVVPALAVKKQSRGKTFAIHIQDPAIPPRHFDMLVVPEHDTLRGPNVLVTRGAVHRVSPAVLSQAALKWAPRFAALKSPKVAVLIGGTSGVHRLTPTIMATMARQLADMVRADGVSLMVTPSRRTGAENEAILRQHLDGLGADIWNGSGDNPYFGYLALADAIVATGDSVNMVSEAVSSDKPVMIVDLEGGSVKFNRFHDAFRQAGYTRSFQGRLEHWSHPPLRETARAAAEAWLRLNAHLGLSPELRQRHDQMHNCNAAE